LLQDKALAPGQNDANSPKKLKAFYFVPRQTQANLIVPGSLNKNIPNRFDVYEKLLTLIGLKIW
jgi:hypothetical protein